MVFVGPMDILPPFDRYSFFGIDRPLQAKKGKSPGNPELVLNLGAVPCLPYRKPVSPELMKQVEKAIKRHDALLLGSHGAVCVAGDIYKAYYRMELVEQGAKIACIAAQMGGANKLTAKQVKELKAAAKKSGYKGR